MKKLTSLELRAILGGDGDVPVVPEDPETVAHEVAHVVQQGN